MKKDFFYNYCLLFFSIIIYLPVSAQFKVEGVVKHNGKSLAGATISIVNGSGQEKEVLTNGAGEYSFSLKPNDEYNIFFTKAGFTKSEIVFSTIGSTEDDAKKFKGVSNPEIELFELPSDETALSKINEILSTPLMSYYYDSDKNSIISDESLEQSLQDELAKIQEIVDEENKKVNPAQELEKQYKKEIAEADKLFAAKNYDMAKTSYNQASALKPSETYPKTRMLEIDKLIADANEKERIAKEKELANASEKERIAKEKELADAKEKERIAKQKAITDAAEQERIAKQKGITDAAEQERIAKQKAIADAAEQERIAKEKAIADAAEQERIAKQKAITDAAEKERIAKEQAIADASEKERLAKEEEARLLNKKYTLAINTGDSAIAAKNYIDAKAAFNEALTLKPTESYPKGRLEQIELELLKSGEFKNELAKKYPQGVTEEIAKESNATVTRRIVVIGNKGVLYLMRRTNFGGVYYFKDDAPISENEFKRNTEVK